MVKCLQFRIVTRAGTSRLLKISVTDPGPGVLAPAGDVIAGYYAVDPLTSADLALAAEFIVARRRPHHRVAAERAA